MAFIDRANTDGSWFPSYFMVYIQDSCHITFQYLPIIRQLCHKILKYNDKNIKHETLQNINNDELGRFVLKEFSLEYRVDLDRNGNDIKDDESKVDKYMEFYKSNYYKGYQILRDMNRNNVSCCVNDFEKMNVSIGKGTFGLISCCRKKDTAILYAMKKIDVKMVYVTEYMDSIVNEINVLKLMNHRFVISLKYAFFDETYIYLILDWMVGRTLRHHIKMKQRRQSRCFNLNQCKFFAAQILLGLEYIHSHGIIHRNLDLNSIWMDHNGFIKISDFNLSAKLIDNNGINDDVSNDHGYHGKAPELILGQYYGYSVDYFSFGVIIYEMISGIKPFLSKIQMNDLWNDHRKYNRILNKNIISHTPAFSTQYFDGNSRSLIKGLIMKDYKNRLGYNGINEIKNHPFFHDIQFDSIQNGNIESPYKHLYNFILDKDDDFLSKNLNNKFKNIELSAEFRNKLHKYCVYTRPGILNHEVLTLLKIGKSRLVNVFRNYFIKSATNGIEIENNDNNGKCSIM